MTERTMSRLQAAKMSSRWSADTAQQTPQHGCSWELHIGPVPSPNRKIQAPMVPMANGMPFTFSKGSLDEMLPPGEATPTEKRLNLKKNKRGTLE